uniref:Fibroblast growth factor n=1 Tax=Rattus norvegicus TaxID=10116 RepID=A0ABK0LBX6_RAT
GQQCGILSHLVTKPASGGDCPSPREQGLLGTGRGATGCVRRIRWKKKEPAESTQTDRNARQSCFRLGVHIATGRRDDDQDTEAHLEIREDGTVVGTAHRSPESLLELKALKPGVIQILGVKASRFLCQQPDGTLYGSPHFDPEACSFRELLLKDGYNVYQSEAHGLPLRLPQKDSQDPATRGPVRFLPMPGLPHEPQEQPGVLPPEPPDVGSSDPLSMVEPLQGRSPSYAS